MRVLVLDAIHGGKVIGAAYQSQGDDADVVDVYRDEGPVGVREAAGRVYDLAVAPVHLDPSYPLLRDYIGKVISHHDAVRELLGNALPHLFVEVTGARGKTTTAHLLASLLPGRGVLHTTRGTTLLPEGRVLWRQSITPASLLPAAEVAVREGRWLVAEVSLGVTGAGDLALLTSGEDYPIAAGQRSALKVKQESLRGASRVITPPGVHPLGPGWIAAEEMVRLEGDTLCYTRDGAAVRVSVPLAGVPGYCVPVMMAAAGALALGADPADLRGALPVEGRMQVKRTGGITIVDNSGSGTTGATAVVSAGYARTLGTGPLTLVIGQEGRSVCEGFAGPDLAVAVRAISPQRVILVEPESGVYRDVERETLEMKIPVQYAQGLSEAEDMALDPDQAGIVLLSVKTWR